MGKFRPRLKGKGKRWAKGHSSSSNPETKKYRDVAKSRFFQDNVGQGSLTSEALQKHNAFLGTKDEDTQPMVVDGETVAGTFSTVKTFKTFASDWSDCSNASFSRLLKTFRSDSALHKEMLAVLAAVTEVIKSNGGSETTTEYFGALMTTLDVTESEESIGAVLSLLGMGIKNVPENVLRLKFSPASKTFMELLAKFAESDNNVVLRSLLGCLSVLLRVQEVVVWSNHSTLHVLDAILAFTTHSKPKVRKAAQHAVCAILKGSCFMLQSEQSPPTHHPAAGHVAKFCVRQLEDGGMTTTLHLLTLLRDVLPTFPRPQLKATCEALLKLMTLSKALVTSCALQVLHGLFSSRPSTDTLPPAMNAQLLSALYDFQPPVTDTQPTLAWLAVLQEAYSNLARTDLSLCVSHLPRLFSTVTALWLSPQSSVHSAATHCLRAAVVDCIGPASRHANHKMAVGRVFGTVQQGLGYQYHSAWPQVLHLLAALFEAAGEHCAEVMLPCLRTLADLRDSHQFSHAAELEHAVGRAVRSMGPRVVLEAIPLKLTGQEDSYEFPRSWMLPVLRENVQGTQLHFFLEYFLPLATVCRRQSTALAAKNDRVGAHSYDLLQSQIWALLPSFCNKPTDVTESFKSIAKVLGTAISECPDLRTSVMAAIRRLVSGCRERQEEAAAAELARYAKNYIPILFNVYTTHATGTDGEGQRLAALETARAYLPLAGAELSAQLIDKAEAKLDSETDAFIREAVLDLIRVLLPVQDEERVSRVYKRVTGGMLVSESRREQKKAYRLLEELCSCESVACQEFVRKNLAAIYKVLVKSLATSAVSSKGPRLRCLSHLVLRLRSQRADVLQKVVPEAVLCCCDLNERCRAAAYQLLVDVGQVMLRWTCKPKADIMRDYAGLLMAGLAGTPTLAGATVLALAHVSYEFKDMLPEDVLQMILDNVCLLMTSATREIVVAALSYIKMYLSLLSTTSLGPSVPVIVRSLVAMTDDCKRHFRLKTRDILDRLVRKFGHDTVASLVPVKDDVMHKRLRNLRKIQARKKRLRDERSSRASQEDDEETFSVKRQPKSIEEILAESDSDVNADDEVMEKRPKARKSQAWIQEDPESIVDFTDATTARSISATHPATVVAQQQSKKKKESAFKTAPDGRLIIRDDSDEDDDERPVRRKRKGFLEPSDSGDSDLDEPDGRSSVAPLAGRKRCLSESTDVRSEPANKYQAGGSGIHRPVRQPRGKKKAHQEGPTAFTGSEYRATKARGDIKRKGKPDPYAYVPLSRKTLNKRKKVKYAGQFTNLVRAARKGAMKGAKAKGKAVKRNQ